MASYYQVCLEKLRAVKKTSRKVAVILVEVRTGYLQNTGQKH